MAIRPATMLDLQALLRMGAEEAKRYPALRASDEKMRTLAREAISSARHFCWVSEDESGSVQGALVGVAGDNLWAQRGFCSVVLWTSKVSGDGAALLRRFREWVVSRPVIRVAGFSVDTEVDGRALSLMERIGFKKHGGSYLLYTRGNAHGAF